VHFRTISWKNVEYNNKGFSLIKENHCSQSNPGRLSLLPVEFSLHNRLERIKAATPEKKSMVRDTERDAALLGPGLLGFNFGGGEEWMAAGEGCSAASDVGTGGGERPP
jgi:hypothetical protein